MADRQRSEPRKSTMPATGGSWNKSLGKVWSRLLQLQIAPTPRRRTRSMARRETATAQKWQRTRRNVTKTATAESTIIRPGPVATKTTITVENRRPVEETGDPVSEKEAAAAVAAAGMAAIESEAATKTVAISTETMRALAVIVIAIVTTEGNGLVRPAVPLSRTTEERNGAESRPGRTRNDRLMKGETKTKKAVGNTRKTSKNKPSIRPKKNKAPRKGKRPTKVLLRTVKMESKNLCKRALHPSPRIPMLLRIVTRRRKSTPEYRNLSRKKTKKNLRKAIPLVPRTPTKRRIPSPIKKRKLALILILAPRPRVAIKSAAIVQGTETETTMVAGIVEIAIIAGGHQKRRMVEVATAIEIDPRRDGAAATRDARAVELDRGPDPRSATGVREEAETIATVAIGETGTITRAATEIAIDVPITTIPETTIDAPGTIDIPTTTTCFRARAVAGGRPRCNAEEMAISGAIPTPIPNSAAVLRITVPITIAGETISERIAAATEVLLAETVAVPGNSTALPAVIPVVVEDLRTRWTTIRPMGTTTNLPASVKGADEGIAIAIDVDFQTKVIR
mmetsp:Transcript_12934/g.30513  ORF Transcript_12934/g.30513 Transcript_12934/m.30513 type:complete len:567 (-) Transcript_12934:80-1780(-)